MVCEECKRSRVVMVVMEPGDDKIPWALCGSCWVDGLRSMTPSDDESKLERRSRTTGGDQR